MRFALPLPLVVAAALAAALVGAAPAEAASKAEKSLKKAVAEGNAAGAVAAIEQLGDENDEKAAKFILKVALSADGLNKRFTPEDTNDIFEAARAALAGMSDAKALRYLYKNARSHRDERVRVILVEVCGVKQDPEAEEALVEALRDRDDTVQATAARILGARAKLHSPQGVIDQLIAVLLETEGDRRAPWQDVLMALAHLSGEQFATGIEWQDWWKVQRDKFDPAGKPKRKPGVSDTVRREAPKLFGKEILSKKVIFVLDVSGSMAVKDPVDESGRRGKFVDAKDPDYFKIPEERMRMFRLKKAMTDAIKDLPEDTRFTIVTFSSEIKVWKPKLVPASGKTKGDAIDFTNSMVPLGFTWTDAALEEAFNVPEANTIYLFSDGIPQRAKGEKIPRDEILEKVRQLNRVRKVRIYTIGFGEADADFMGKLANEHGGDFTPVD